MNDTCTTHRSRVPRRSSEGLNEEWQQWKTREDQAWNFSLCFVCGSRPWGAAAFHLCLFILLLKCEMFAGSRLLLPVSINFIINYSTCLAPFPRLSAPPHSSQGSFWQHCRLYTQLFKKKENLFSFLVQLLSCKCTLHCTFKKHFLHM